MTKGTEYAQAVVNGKATAPKYVIKQCEEYLSIVNGEDEIAFLDEKKYRLIENLTRVMIMPKGLKVGQSLYECMTGYQWLILEAALCVFREDDHAKRRYETVVLEIARKNFKTFTVAIIMIIAFLTEPKFSKFYSVAPTGDLSKEVRNAIEEIITVSPLLYSYKGKERFKILRDSIKFKPTKTQYFPLNFALHKMDGKLPSIFVADEVGALSTNYPIEAMRSGQMGIKNRLGVIISTKYPTGINPLEDEVSYAKKVLDGLVEDDTYFSLLYEPDEPDKWMTDDKVLLQANPVAEEMEETWELLKDRRKKAIEVPAVRENFLTKHCNIIYSGADAESYIDIDDLKQCRAEKPIDWTGRVVYVGVDFAMTNDNCAIAMVAEDNGNIIAKAWAFIPEDKTEQKIKEEKVDYKQYIREGSCIACGDRVVDYSVMEQFVFDLEDKYGVEIQAIGYDRYNALSSAQKWEVDFNTVEVKQHSSVLHSPTKLLSEQIEQHKFRFDESELLEINFANAKCVYDTNLNRYVNKKKSSGKIDMVMAILDGLCLLEKDVILDGETNFVVQTF